MAAFQDRLRRFLNPWTELLGERGMLHPGDRIAIAAIWLWLACVPVAVWIAVGDPPQLLSDLAMTFLWVIGGFYFLCGLPILFVPVYLFWVTLFAGRAAKDEGQEESQIGFEAAFEMRRRWVEAGLVPEEHGFPPRRSGVLHCFVSGIAEAVFHPPLLLQFCGWILTVALFAGDHTLLALAYAVPGAAWYLFEASRWAVQRWRRA